MWCRWWAFRDDSGAFPTLLDHPKDLQRFFRACEQLARAQIPIAIQACIRLGRLTALQKQKGGNRGVVSGDPQLMDSVQRATAPYQYAMSTKSWCECIAHALQGLTELDPRATVMSIDCINAYDLISRRAMLPAFDDVAGWNAAVPFVSMFYGTPSNYLWEDSLGRVHTITKGEGGEQGNAIMPFPWVSTQRRTECSSRYVKEKFSSRSLMMCTLSPCLIACVTFTVSWKRVCGPSQASGCMKKRPSSGMPFGRVQVTRGCNEQPFLLILQQWCGWDPRICHHIVVASKCWGHLQATRILCAPVWRCSAHIITHCWRAFPWSRTCSRRGCCSFTAHLLGRTMLLELSSLRWQPRFVRDMTPGCGSVCAEFSTYLQGKGRRCRSCFHAFCSEKHKVAICLSWEHPSVLGELGRHIAGDCWASPAGCKATGR